MRLRATDGGADCHTGKQCTAATQCDACTAGKYKDVPGPGRCKKCPPNTYSGALGVASSCTACPAHSKTNGRADKSMQTSQCSGASCVGSLCCLLSSRGTSSSSDRSSSSRSRS
mmetsp:Transcript_1657/g.3971  ORF Transcript_1657/g.3971 Transcript_1657/m.3971 type:complete len:114 (+) Transcript_1657:759-1100(+)